MRSRRLFKLQSMLPESSQDRDVVWREADSKRIDKKESMKKAFQDMLHRLGEVNPTHAYYTCARSVQVADTEDPSWSTSFKTRRTQKTSSSWKMLLKDFYLCCI
ncbi:hypothetical protein Tco_0158113 [Tanacetum coccineum]